MPLLRMKKTMVNSWRGLIACFRACILYSPLELLISKQRKTFPALVHNRERQIVWNDLRRFSSFPKTLNRLCSKLPLTGHLPNHLENLCIQKEERSPLQKRFSIRKHYNHCKYFYHWLYEWLHQNSWCTLLIALIPIYHFFKCKDRGLLVCAEFNVFINVLYWTKHWGYNNT